MFRSSTIGSFFILFIVFGVIISITLYFIVNSYFTPDSSLESTDLQQTIHTFEDNEEIIPPNTFDISSWSIYTNDELNFEIRYPDTLDFEEYEISKNDDYVVETIVQFTPKLLPGDAANQPTILIDIERSTDFLSIDQWIRLLETTLRNEELLNPNYKVLTIKQTEINSINAVKLVTEGERGRTISYSLFPKNRENIIYDIALLEGGVSSEMPDPLIIFESILQTFKFID